MEKKAARAGVFFNTDVMRRSRMQLAFLEHTRVRTVYGKSCQQRMQKRRRVEIFWHQNVQRGMSL